MSETLRHAPARRYTVYGDDAVEALVRQRVRDAAAWIARRAPRGAVTAVVLFGGYGKGEGGVEWRQGGWRPHNNLDLLVVCRPGAAARVKGMLPTIVAEFQRQAPDDEVEIHASVATPPQLRRDHRRVMWHDLREGHQVAWGPPGVILDLLPPTDPGAISPWSMRDLLVNRGALLVFNEALLARNPITPRLARLALKHQMKAILGYGDALLYSRGQYHWSYREKQRRMRALADIPADFQSRYEAAVEFRFRPCHEQHAGRDLAAAQRELARVLEPTHLQFEQWRLRAPGLCWSDYPGRAIHEALRGEFGDWRGWARQARNLLRGLPRGWPGDWRARLAARRVGLSCVLSAVFPLVCFQPDSPATREVCAQALPGAGDGAAADPRRAYLRAWADHRDENLRAVCAFHGVTL